MGIQRGYSATFTRDFKELAKFNRICYTKQLGEAQGTQVYNDDMFGDAFYNIFHIIYSMWSWKVCSASINGLQSTYNYKNGDPIDIRYTFKCDGGTVNAINYTATITKVSDDPEIPDVPVTSVTEIGHYQLAVTGKEVKGYHGTATKDFFVTATSLATNEEGHILINSAADWNTLCNLSSTDNYSQYFYFGERVVELTADISVSCPIPVFCGILEVSQKPDILP